MSRRRQLSVLAIFIIVLLIVGFYFWQKTDKVPQTKEEAIKQAQEYRPEGICTDALVPAIHEATGAKYTFSSGCLAPGWKPEERSIPDKDNFSESENQNKAIFDQAVWERKPQLCNELKGKVPYPQYGPTDVYEGLRLIDEAVAKEYCLANAESGSYFGP